MNHSSLIDRLKSAFEQRKLAPSGVMDALAYEIEDAVRSGDAQLLAQISESLASTTRELLARVPSVAKELREGDEDGAANDVLFAFGVGQLNFAQLLASQVLSHSENGDFLDAIANITFTPYISLLAQGPKTNKQIQEAIRHAEGTVSRKLAVLRELGICDYRKQGTHTVNFLTPAAQKLFSEMQPISTQQLPDVEVAKVLAKLREEIPAHLKKPMTFSPNSQSQLAPLS